MPSDILTIADVKLQLGFDATDSRFDGLLDYYLTAFDGQIKRLRGQHPADPAQRDPRLPVILLQLVVLGFRNSPYLTKSERGITLTAKQYDDEINRILSPLSWVYDVSATTA